MKKNTMRLTNEETLGYTNLITSLVNTAVIQTDGIAKELSAGKKKTGFTLSSRNTHIYIENNEVTIDVYINVVFGYSVPQVACDLQERIIFAIKKNTPLIPKAVNVNVSDAIFL